jgi:hypothetical protein
MPRKTSKPDPLAHPRYDRSQPLLRELAYVNVTGDGGIWFDPLLTRVPAIGEEIIRDAELQPEDEPQTQGRHKPLSSVLPRFSKQQRSEMCEFTLDDIGLAHLGKSMNSVR